MNIIQIAVMTLLPFLELRASIPYGILILKESVWLVYLVSVITNMILALILFPLIDQIIRTAKRFKFIEKTYNAYVTHTQKKIQKYTDRYGELGLVIFIGIPLPGSGVYSGALAAYLLGMNFKRFIFAAALGVLIAGTIVTLVTISSTSGFNIFIK